MKCPKCSSANTKRLEVIFDEGTSEGTATSFLFGDKTDGLAVTRSTSMTRLAQKAAPPVKKSYVWAVIPWCVTVVSFIWGLSLNATAFIWSLIFGVMAAFISYGVWRHNTFEVPKRYREWIKSWCCLKCGSLFKK